MPNFSLGPTGPKLIPAPEPKKGPSAQVVPPAYTVGYEHGTGHEPLVDSQVAKWVIRQQAWRDGFMQAIAPNAKKYWQLWRNIDPYPLWGPDLVWRDQTVVPGPFRTLMTRVPRLVMAQFGAKEWFVVEGREKSDRAYEALVKSLLDAKLAQIGEGERGEGLFVAAFNGFLYEQIMGHVWWKLTYKRDVRMLKTRMPEPGDDGKISWKMVEVPEIRANGLDFCWLPLDRLAVNLEGPRLWAIEPVYTTLEALQREDENYYKINGERLYPPEAMEQLAWRVGTGSPDGKDSYTEPRDTESWPLLQAERRWGLTGETIVELWYCWDNDQKTLTKIANRNVVLDHGYAPTPDGLDPYWGTSAVPIPGRVYGDSYLNWTGDLHKYSTRLKRGRADEILLNLFQQFVYRTGAITSPKLLFQPGGAIGVETVDPSANIMESFGILPRRAVFEEAWREQALVEQEAEKTCAADVISQGAEATQKSRDVSATEVQQRVLQGNARYQMENLYKEVSWKKPLLTRAFELLKMNMTEPEVVRVLGESKTIDLTHLQSPVDIKVGGGIYEFSKAERGRDVLEMVGLAQNEIFAPYLKPFPILKELLRVRDWPNPEEFLRTEQEVEVMGQRALEQQQMGEGGSSGNPSENQQALAGMASMVGSPSGPTDTSGMPGLSSAAGPLGAGGAGPEAAPIGPNNADTEEF